MNAGNVYIFFSESDRPGGPWEQLSGVALMETLQAEIVENGDWRITNPEGPWWEGRASTRTMAILDYLRSRLGIPKAGEEEAEAERERRDVHADG